MRTLYLAVLKMEKGVKDRKGDNRGKNNNTLVQNLKMFFSQFAQKLSVGHIIAFFMIHLASYPERVCG